MRYKPGRLSTVEARQGSRTRMNFRVLVVSMIILAGLLLALYAAFYGSATPTN